MKLKDYIQQEIRKGRRDFDIGINLDGTVDDKSPTRVKFQVKCSCDKT